MSKGFKKTGQWRKVRSVANGLQADLEAARHTTLLRWGLKAEGIAAGHISNQDLPWKPLSQSWLDTKERKGWSENIYVATSSYFQGITSEVEGNVARVGVRRVRTSDGEPIVNIARVLEFGSKSAGIPARPLWRPTLSEVSAWQLVENHPGEHWVRLVRRRL